MAHLDKIGIVGAGIAGLTLATLLADSGKTVEVLERAPEPTSLGSGITLQGNALRILRELGVWPELLAAGFPANTLCLRAPDDEGTVLAMMEDVRTGGEDLPSTLGMYRPELAAIIRARAAAAGVVTRHNAQVCELRQQDDHVTVTLENGDTHTYDILIGADGINSAVRQLIGITTAPEPTGVGAWRAVVPRPDHVVQSELTYGGPHHIAGCCPTSQDTMYAYIVEDAHERDVETDWEVLRSEAECYGGTWHSIRKSITAETAVNYTQFTAHFVEGDWHRGRVMLIGDAAHSCPPTLAQGAAMAIEDAAVLAEEMIKANDLDPSRHRRSHPRVATRDRVDGR